MKEYEVQETQLQFHCDYAVYPKGGSNSICYCTDPVRADIVKRALEMFANSEEYGKHIATLQD